MDGRASLEYLASIFQFVNSEKGLWESLFYGVFKNSHEISIMNQTIKSTEKGTIGHYQTNI